MVGVAGFRNHSASVPKAAQAARADVGIGPYKAPHQLPCAITTPCSGTVGAAFEETPVAVTAGDSTGPRKALLGYQGTTPTGPIGPDSFRVAASWDVHRAAPWGPGAAAPGAFWEPSPRGKVPRRRHGEGPRHAGYCPADEAAAAARAADSRPYDGDGSLAGARPKNARRGAFCSAAGFLDGGVFLTWQRRRSG